MGSIERQTFARPAMACPCPGLEDYTWPPMSNATAPIGGTPRMADAWKVPSLTPDEARGLVLLIGTHGAPRYDATLMGSRDGLCPVWAAVVPNP
jgi:hypothetical protein